MAALRAVRCCAVGESDPRSSEQQVPGIRVRHDDQLRRGCERHPAP